MPVIVVGADTDTGRKIVERFLDPEREVRAFVTDSAAADRLRNEGAKVALGDVSDDSHLAGACLNCFSVVLVGDAAWDGRECHFAPTPEKVMEAWANAVRSASVQRVIWVIPDAEPPPTLVDEVAVVDPATPDVAEVVFELDRVARL